MRVVVIGAGIVGLAVARELQSRPGVTEVVVLEKERQPGVHQSGRNSGVVHAGIYYPPGSLKARLSVRGMRLLREYCAARGLPYRERGKLIIARDGDELGRLTDLRDRAVANGVEGVELLGPDGICDLEPEALGLGALHSPRTAVCDFGAVVRSLAADLERDGGELRTGAAVRGVGRSGRRLQVRSETGMLAADRVVNCAGLHSDRVATASGDRAAPRIIPFKGRYLQVTEPSAALVRGLIYPVPDPRYPFLGVHLTRGVHEVVTVGPSALLALSRERYHHGDFAPADLYATAAWPGFWRLAREHWRTGVREFADALWPRRVIAAAREYVPGLAMRDARRDGAGIRAQAVGADGAIVDDFVLHDDGEVAHVRNAPSPAATSSLALGELIADRVLGAGG